METRAAYVAVGTFVLALSIGVVIAVLWLAHAQFNEAKTRYDIYFAYVGTGLGQGSPVRISGVTVGRVVRVGLDSDNPGRVRVTVEVDADAPIRSDSVASIEITSLTGGAAVEVTPGSKSAPPIQMTGTEPNPIIWSRESDIQQLVASFPQLLNKVTDLTVRLSDTLDDKNRAALAATLDNLSKVTAVAAAHSNDIDQLIVNGAADMKDLKQAITSLNDAAVRVDTLAANAGDAVNDFRGLVRDNRAPLKDFTQNGLDELRQLLAQTSTLVATMNRTMNSIERDPSLLLYGDRRQGYRPQ
ncbi:MAG TPA: MlaD family protein [Stellaceae bacterium]|jgi:phospholipid/cholesterol/gamma-HCH transport system substrate-binding protein|nr:MlaD family protein [Stellaceae bacterium]